MSNDVFYGADCELRLGLMADKDTMPTAWWALEFNRLAITPNRATAERPRLGAARHNKLDPLKPRLGLERFSADLVVDADTLMAGRWLRAFLGAPTTSGPATGIYTHVWNSGARTELYCAIAVRAGSDKVHVLKAVSLASLSCSWGGENVQDFDLQMALMALDRSREDDWPSGAVTSVTTPAPILRGSLLVDGVAADQVVSAGFTWDRNLQADAYAATGSGHRLASYLRPGEQPTHSGQATVRTFGTTFDTLADGASNDTTDASFETRLLGVTSGHMIKLAQPQARLTQPPLEIGSGVIERSLAWTGHQTDSNPATRISLLNNVSSYA